MDQEQMYVPLNFCGLSEELSSWEKSRAVIIPVPYDLTTSYLSGTRHGPLAIIKASTHLELFDEEIKNQPCSIGIHTLPELEVTTAGPAAMIDRVEKVAAQIINSHKLPVLLGGEHSSTLGMVRALKKHYPAMGVLQLDAHADLRNSYQESPFNHACIGRRISECCPLVQAGIRSLSQEEFEFLPHPSIDTFYAAELQSGSEWVDRLIAALPEHIYITIDLDVFDPSCMPAVGTPEPGGLGWYQLIHVLKTAALRKKIVGFDIVELCPQSANPGPDFLAAKLCYKLLGYIFLCNKL